MISLHRAKSDETGGLKPIDPRRFAWVLVAFAAFYVLAYLACTDVPAGSGSKSGWWYWFDQGQYLKSAFALAHGQFDPSLHTYPPLYSAMAAPVVGLLPGHPFFPINIIAFVTFIGVLAWIAGRIYGWSVSLLGIVAIMILAPEATIRPWVVPWTTTMSGLLISLQFITAWHLDVKQKPWTLENRWDWFCVGAFFIAFSDLAATRPLDFVAFLPFAAVVFARLEIAAWLGSPADRRWRACMAILFFCVALCALCAAILITFNLLVYGSLISGYVQASANGYSFANVPHKFYSIFMKAGPIYSDAGDAIFEKMPVFAVVFASVLVALFTAKPFIKGVIAVGLFQILLYLPFPDLMPPALYRFGELHYFKWMLLWFAVIGFAELISWFQSSLLFPARFARSAALLAILIVFANLTLYPVARAEIEDRRDVQARTLDIGPISAEQVSYVDLPGLTGDFTAIYLNRSLLSLNGWPMMMTRDFRFIPYRDGARLVFIKAQSVKDIHIEFNPGVTLDAASAKLSLYDVQLGFGGSAAMPPLRADSP